jgi:DNA polymerase-1
MVAAFREGADIHVITAADIFGVMLPLVTPAMRRSAKTINFGILYGMGPHRLARELKISRKEAEQFIERYFNRFGRVRSFIEHTLEQARTLGYVTTLEGRRRYVPDLGSSNHNVRQGAERIAVNTPIQGSAADIIKRAMVSVQGALVAEKRATRMLLQVHDELVLEAPESEVAWVKEMVKEKMETVTSLRVPLVVDVGAGTSWAEAH